MIASWRTSALAERHRALGSGLEDWNGRGIAWNYDGPTSADDEYVAIRTKASLMDVSGLKKLHVSGPHAATVINRAVTRNIEKLGAGRSTYACMLNDRGKFVDDCVVYRMGPNSFMFVHGTGSGNEQLMHAAAGRDVAIQFDDNLHDLSLQGPLAVDFLAKHVEGIRNLNYFCHTQAKLFGFNIMISRTGYTGERGYEIFCRAQDAASIWDNILEEGAPMGIIPTRFSTLDKLRVESYLLFYPFDNSDVYPFDDEPCGDTLWELGLDFTVSADKQGFIGAEEHYRSKGKERFKIFGVLIDGDKAVGEGAEIYRDGKNVGVVTFSSYSPLMKQTMGIARVPVDCAVHGTPVEIKDEGATVKAIAHSMPFYDPDKKIRMTKG